MDLSEQKGVSSEFWITEEQSEEKCQEGNTIPLGTEEQTETFDNELASEVKSDTTRKVRWCMTSFETSPPTELHHDDIRYYCYAPEETKKGKKHWQCYFEFLGKNGKSLKWIKENFHAKWHLAWARGTGHQNRIYCGADRYQKGDKVKERNPNFVEWGEITEQGSRKQEVKALADRLYAGETVQQIRKENPHAYHQWGRTLIAIEDDIQQSRRRDYTTLGLHIHGATGTKKSWIMTALIHGRDVYWHNTRDKDYWTSYNQQEICVFDDLRGTDMRFNDVLQLVNHTHVSVPRKGRDVIPFTSKKVIVTSVLDPEQLWEGQYTERDSIDQYKRRFLVVNTNEFGWKRKVLDFIQKEVDTIDWAEEQKRTLQEIQDEDKMVTSTKPRPTVEPVLEIKTTRIGNKQIPARFRDKFN